MSRYDSFREIFLHVNSLEKLWFLRWESNGLLREIHDLETKRAAEERQLSQSADDSGRTITDIAAELQDLVDALTDWKPRSSHEAEQAENHIELASSTIAIPEELPRLIDETLELVRAHPRHEMGQRQRRKIYEAQWTTPQGEKASQWQAILAARCVQPIYEQAIAANHLYNTEFVARLLDRMLDVAEKIMTGVLTLGEVAKQEASGEIEDFYHNLLVLPDDKFPSYIHLALMAAYNALAEAQGSRPLQTRISGEVKDEQGNVTFSASDTWTDDWLAGSGSHADDAAVDAAYAFARRTERGHYDAAKLLEFWEWWLKTALPQAWQKAKDQLNRSNHRRSE